MEVEPPPLVVPGIMDPLVEIRDGTGTLRVGGLEEDLVVDLLLVVVVDRPLEVVDSMVDLPQGVVDHTVDHPQGVVGSMVDLPLVGVVVDSTAEDPSLVGPILAPEHLPAQE